MKPYTFNGKWEFPYQFDAFKGLRSAGGDGVVVGLRFLDIIPVFRILCVFYT